MAAVWAAGPLPMMTTLSAMAALYTSASSAPPLHLVGDRRQLLGSEDLRELGKQRVLGGDVAVVEREQRLGLGEHRRQVASVEADAQAGVQLLLRAMIGDQRGDRVGVLGCTRQGTREERLLLVREVARCRAIEEVEGALDRGLVAAARRLDQRRDLLVVAAMTRLQAPERVVVAVAAHFFVFFSGFAGLSRSLSSL